MHAPERRFTRSRAMPDKSNVPSIQEATTFTLTPIIANGGIVQGVVMPREHSLSKKAVTVVVPELCVASSAVRYRPCGALETSLSIDGSPIDTGDTFHGPGRPYPPIALLKVSFSLDPERRHTVICCVS
jgi:hypothetical protein